MNQRLIIMLLLLAASSLAVGETKDSDAPAAATPAAAEAARGEPSANKEPSADNKPSADGTASDDVAVSAKRGALKNPASTMGQLPLEELRIFAEAFDRISKAYVEEVDDKTLLNNAIRGLLDQLDPHSAFLDSKTFERLQESTTGNYGGLGIEIGTEEGLIKVVTPIDDTPAAKAGILPGDLIVQIEGQSIRSMGVSEAVEIMRGAPGSSVTLSVVRQGEPNPIEITLTREVINIASVRQRLLEPYFGYIRVAQFQADTGSEVATAIEKLESETPLKGLIIDLRNNPGGVLQAAVALSDLFIREGLIVYTEGRLENAAIKYRASDKSVLEGVPLVILVNEGSASASEIVAGALQDHGRAIIMGTRTFGKGSVQTVLQLTSDKAIKLTTALYFTPLGRSIQAEGIAPDLWIDRSTVTKIKSNPFRLKEKDLPGHLNAPTTEQGLEENSAQPEAAFANDFQLREALTLLKGINILSDKNKSTDTL